MVVNSLFMVNHNLSVQIMTAKVTDHSELRLWSHGDDSGVRVFYGPELMNFQVVTSSHRYRSSHP